MDEKNLNCDNVKSEDIIDVLGLPDEEKVNEYLKEYDSESRFAITKGFRTKIVSFACIAMSIFHLYIASPIGTMPSNKVRMIHLAFVLFLIFLLFPMFKSKDKKDNTTVFDYILAVLGIIPNIYLFFNIDAISMRAGVMSNLDIVMAILTVILVLEATRRCIGSPLTILAIISLLYAYLGPNLPGALMHRGFGIKRLAEHMFISAEGIYGIPLGVSATVIFLFILFGSFLAETGLSKFFTNAALGFAGHKVGGPAKVSIISSGLLGMINGSAAANVVTTGAFTIPLMKRLGYKPFIAGAVEAVASTGGQIMPPVMGAAAFIMAEYLAVPYSYVMIVAIIPAVLYYVSLWINIDLEARKTGLACLPKDQLPDVKAEFKENWHLIIPIILLVTMLMKNFTPSYSAFFGIVALVIVSYFKKHSRLKLYKLLKALESGAKQGLSVAIACGVVGLVIGVVNLTGLGLQLANIVIGIAKGNLFFTLILTMIAVVILGMGMPTSGAYIVGATVGTQALTALGVSPTAAHLFVFYFAALSAITPPVALASYAGAGIADANVNKVGWTAVRLGLIGFIIPFMFIYSPPLLMIDSTPIQVVLAFTSATIGCLALGGATQGYLLTKLNIYERIICFAAAMLLIKSGSITDMIGLVLLALVIFSQKKRSKYQPNEST